MPERFHLELEPDGGEAWAPVAPLDRLRRLVKASARSYGLRCVAVRQAGAPAPATPSDHVRELTGAGLSPAEAAEAVGCSEQLAVKAVRRTPRQRAPDGRRKVDVVRDLLTAEPGLSNAAIARRAGCDRGLVIAARQRGGG